MQDTIALISKEIQKENEQNLNMSKLWKQEAEVARQRQKEMLDQGDPFLLFGSSENIFIHLRKAALSLKNNFTMPERQEYFDEAIALGKGLKNKKERTDDLERLSEGYRTLLRQ